MQIDIDSDVHPELHAVLASVVRGAARAERLRQLAAAGLIWEHLRVQTQPLRAADAAAAASAGSAARGVPPDAVPVLWDAVDAAAAAPPAAVAACGDATHAEAAQGEPARAGEGRDIAVPAARKPGTRPRLLRMKERGLFQNGQDN
ncbi:MAG TPA: hypothetical protein PKB14_00610 [Rubrivivax sp.]|nr:hypothetical protein [Rubrivivax sp.]